MNKSILVSLLFSFSVAANPVPNENRIAYDPSILQKSLQEKNKKCGKVVKYDFKKNNGKCKKKNT